MFSFQVRKRGDDRLGSVVSEPMVIDGGVCVVVMWEDNYTFSHERVTALEAVPHRATLADGEKVVPFGESTH